MMKRLFVPFVSCVLLLSCGSGNDEYRLEPGMEDYTAEIRRILSSCGDEDVTISFAPGIYDFYPEDADSMYMTVSNNDNGVKKVIFNLAGKKNITVAGEDSELMFHGAVVPFYVEDCSDVRLKGLTVDYDVPFLLEGEVMAVDETGRSIDLKVTSGVKCRIADGKLLFSGYDWELGLGNNIVFDPATMSPYWNTARFLHRYWEKALEAEELGDSLYRLSGFNSRELPPVGSVYVDKGPNGQNRLYPCIVVKKSRNISLGNMAVHCAGAMALVCENTENVDMDSFDVCLREGSGRFITSSADATHFVNCTGKISFDGCLFENMLDDATNVHGVYMPVDSISGQNVLYAGYGHCQQAGFRFAEPGDTLTLTDRKSLMPVMTFVAEDVRYEGEKMVVIKADRELLMADGGTYAVENSGKCPAVEMRNCIVRNNRARSILLTTSRPVLVEDNYFESMMAGILISGDANKWFESGAVSDVVIRRNEFVNMGKGGENPQSVLQVSPEIPVESRDAGRPYHGRILFEDNLVRTFDSQVIYVLSAGDVTIRNNRFVCTDDYEQIFPGLSYIDMQHCGNVDICGNSCSGPEDIIVSVHNCLDVRFEAGQSGFPDTLSDAPNTFFYQQ